MNSSVDYLFLILLVGAPILTWIYLRKNKDLPVPTEEFGVFNNIKGKESLKAELYDAFTNLANILVDHAGPFATSSVIGSRWRQSNDIDEFTKDGIKIALHLIVSEDVSARFAARMARFVGIAVDKRCHDGTTTSMLLFCQLAKLAIEKMDDGLDSRERANWHRHVRAALDECLTRLNYLKISDQDIYDRAVEMGIETSLEEVRASVAYHMAMISSKGDHDLSSKIAEVIRSSPKKVYGMFKNTALSLETDEAYSIKEQDYDLSVAANPGSAKVWNYKNDTQYLSENAVIFYTGDDIIRDSFDSIFLRSFISTRPIERANLAEFGVDKGWEEFHEGKRSLIIFTPMLNDVDLIADILEFNRANPNNQIVYFNVQLHNRMRTHFNKTIHYMAGKQRFRDVSGTNALDCLIGLDRPVKVHCIGHNVQISNLYDRDGKVFHPYYDNPEAFPKYTEYREEVEEAILFAETNITNESLNPEEVTQLTSLYRSLTCQRILDIELGGSAHDQYANSTVYEDAIGAALSAVSDGVVFGGYGHLSQYLSFHADNYTKSDIEEELYTEFSKAMAGIVADSVRAEEDVNVYQMAIDDLNSRWSYIVADTERFLSGEDHVLVDTFDKEKIEQFLKREPGVPILLQAWSGYHEQFRRFRDILPKLANTTHLVDMRIQDPESVR